MDLTTHSKTRVDDDESWLKSEHGTPATDPITLDGSTFTGTWTDGRVPSGVPLALLASGLWAPFEGGADEIQSLVATGGSAGTFTLTFSGQTTAAIAYNATAAAVKTALIALSNIGDEDVITAGGPLPTTPVTITFVGALAGTNVAALTVTDSVTGGDAVITTTTAGDSGAVSGQQAGYGLLRKSVQVINGAGTTDDPGGALFTHGRVLEANLPLTVSREFKQQCRGILFL